MLEFLQQEWINNGNFMRLGEERDPNVGLQEDGATFTIPREPARRRIHGIETCNVLRAGEYCETVPRSLPPKEKRSSPLWHHQTTDMPVTTVKAGAPVIRPLPRWHSGRGVGGPAPPHRRDALAEQRARPGSLPGRAAETIQALACYWATE